MTRNLTSFFLLSVAALMSGCTTASPIITPTGQQGFTINCTAMRDIGDCYRKAGELCGGNGYEIFNQNTKSGSFFSAADYSMIVRCKSPNEK